MSDDEDYPDDENYDDHQRKWKELSHWGKQHPEQWEENEPLTNEELLAEIEAEREGRERAREEQDDDADEGYGERIRKLEDTAQPVRNRIAYCKGEYSYDDDEQGGEAEQQEEGYGGDDDELEDMDIESDSDSN